MDYKDDRYLKKNQVADNGLLDRRLFLKRGLQFGVITTLTSTASLTSAKENQNTSKNVELKKIDSIFLLRKNIHKS